MKLSDILVRGLLDLETLIQNYSNLNPSQLSALYIESTYSITALEFLNDQIWLKSKQGIELSFNEYAPLSYLSIALDRLDLSEVKKLTKKFKKIENSLITHIEKRNFKEQKTFLTDSLLSMKRIFSDNTLLELYRTFDSLDYVFNINYQMDRDMDVDYSCKERLFERSGVGVQSGYYTILMTLNELDPVRGSKFIDLGSGYGRVGLVYSLLRPDLDIIGYEYVPHRVDNSNEACNKLDLEQSLSFEVQDLSCDNFTIPEADFYYLYDPFSKETYEHVLNQVVRVSLTKKVTLVSKGNATEWISEIAAKHNWPERKKIENTNICIFETK